MYREHFPEPEQVIMVKVKRVETLGDCWERLLDGPASLVSIDVIGPAAEVAKARAALGVDSRGFALDASACSAIQKVAGGVPLSQALLMIS